MWHHLAKSILDSYRQISSISDGARTEAFEPGVVRAETAW